MPHHTPHTTHHTTTKALIKNTFARSATHTRQALRTTTVGVATVGAVAFALPASTDCCGRAVGLVNVMVMPVCSAEPSTPSSFSSPTPSSMSLTPSSSDSLSAILHSTASTQAEHFEHSCTDQAEGRQPPACLHPLGTVQRYPPCACRLRVGTHRHNRG
jgi:hypothetical protein